MHHVYLLLNPLKGFLNYLMMWYPWIVIILLVVLVIRYSSLVRFFYQQIFGMIKKCLQMKQGRGKWVLSWYEEMVQVYTSSFPALQRSAFAQKVKYITLGCVFISGGWLMTSMLFWSFNAGWVSNGIEIGMDTVHMSQDSFARESTKIAKQELAYLEKEGIVAVDSVSVFDVQYMSRIQYILGSVALYIFSSFVLAGFFFLISRGNIFLRNVGWFFVTIGVLIFFGAIVLQLYVMQLGGTDPISV